MHVACAAATVCFSMVSTPKVWDLRRNDVIFSMKGHSDTITGLRLSPSGNYVLSNSMDNTGGYLHVHTDVIGGCLHVRTDVIGGCLHVHTDVIGGYLHVRTDVIGGLFTCAY